MAVSTVCDPDQPDFRMINVTSPSIIELCDGRKLKEVEDQFCSLAAGALEKRTAEEKFEAGPQILQEN